MHAELEPELGQCDRHELQQESWLVSQLSLAIDSEQDPEDFFGLPMQGRLLYPINHVARVRLEEREDALEDVLISYDGFREVCF